VPDVLAAIRPDSVSIALFFHIFGAVTLVGGLFAAGTALAFGWRENSERYLRFGWKALALVAVPGWIVMRIGAQWTLSRENFPDDFEPTWLGIGYITADVGGALLLLAVILGGFGVRKLSGGGGAGLLKASTVLSLVLIAAYLVTVWAMAGKPD
jgi:hypothetical protein